MNRLKKQRIIHSLTQQQMSEILGISLRTYQRYECQELSPKKEDNLIAIINSHFLVDETHGLLSIPTIKELLKPVIQEFNISICILFGSYAKNEATPESDVDLVMDIDNLVGLEFFKFVEKLRSILNKKVDLITTKQLATSREFLETVLREGIRLND